MNLTGGYYLNGARVVISASLRTTSASSDAVALDGMTSAGHCNLVPTNSSAASSLTSTYISGKSANEITVAHAPTSGMTFDILCTPN